MFRKITLTIFTLAALAAPSRGGLTVSVKAPSRLTSIEDLKVFASVTNSGSADVTIFNYGTVLDNIRPTRSFTITKGGEQVRFTGLKLQIDMSNLDESAYTIIKARETVTVEHDLTSLYDFDSLGEGAFEIAPLAQLSVVSRVAGSRPELTPFNFEATPVAKVQITGHISRRSLMGDEMVKRATVNCAISAYASFISSAYTECKELASLAASYITANGADALFKLYFKTNSPSAVIAVFNAIASESTSARTLSCSDPYGVCTGSVIAYTLISGNRPMYLHVHIRSIFYNQLPTSALCNGTTVASRNIRGGTILHEETHAIAGIDTEDIIYGCSACQALSASNQLRNADNYNCFATQVYVNTQC